METVVRIEQIFRDVLNITVPSATTDIIEAGILDSLGLVTLLFEIEEQFGVAIPLEEVDIDGLRTVERIAALVEHLGNDAEPRRPALGSPPT